ncbi:phage holin family protein [Planobispora rosea]|uniref:phage holin family protein n=1 Tax=Planobispora rosea TaxID=35762 RepID=UPI00083AD224|nr:phage holin family protein [Planobispora rosea]
MTQNPATNPAAEPQQESLGTLVAEASSHISALIRAELELAKAEFRFDAKRVGMGVGLFAAAAFIAHLCLILASFTIAYALVSIFDWAEVWAFLAVTLFYVVLAVVMVIIGVRRFKGLTGMKRTLRSLKNLKSGESETGVAAVPAPSTAGQLGSHRESVRPDQ